MRTDQIKQYLANNVFAVCPAKLESLVALVNSGEIAKETINDVAESHSYDVRNGVAVIAVDGATTKKNTWMNAMCGGFIGYDTIAGYVNKAVEDKKVHTLLFHVDTVGGDVAGVDELAELIYGVEKKTVTFYENVGASAGVWWGSASDELYANKTAQIGSIGVMAGYYEQSEDDNKQVVLVSRNAENKNCQLNGSCKEKIQARIDGIEAIFHERVSRNTGLSQEQLIKHFNYGETISADEALKVGFLQGITTLDALVKSLATMPSTEKIANSKKGKIVPKAEELEQEVTAQSATVDTTLEAKVDGISAEDLATAVAQARVDEVQRIKDVEAVIPTAYKDNAEVKAKLYDATTTVEGMKAFLFDMNEKVASEARAEAEASANDVSEDILAIDSSSTVIDDEKQGESLAIVKKMKGIK